MISKSVYSFSGKIFFLILLPGSLGLRDVEIIIPEAVERGKPVTIRCLYDLENVDLYQVKWYRGKKEFCRYEPMEVPPLKIFPIPGIEVDREGTDAKQLTISAATSRTQGHYTCEISAEAPSFLTVQLHGFMYVVDLPKSYPDLIWQQRRIYRPGMKIKAECISYDSMPPANLSFYIHNIPALSEHVRQRVSGGENGSLWTAYSTLEFVVQKHHIIELRIRALSEHVRQRVSGGENGSLWTAYSTLEFVVQKHHIIELRIRALSEHVRQRVSGGENGSLWTAYSTLEFVVQKHHIIELRIRIRCAATIYSIFYKSHEKVAFAEITRTTIAPVIWPQRTTPHPKHRISENRASGYQKMLWKISSIALIVYGQHSLIKY